MNRFKSKVLLLVVLIAVTFVLGSVIPAFAGGAGESLDVPLKRNNIDAFIAIELGACIPVPVPQCNVVVTVIGACKTRVGQFDVAIGPFNGSFLGTEDDFMNSTERSLEGRSFENLNAEGCFSGNVADLEDLIIQRVQKLYSVTFDNGTKALGADVTIKALK